MTKLIAFGDSIFAGWDGKENVSADERIPELIGQHLGWQVTNVAIGGTKYDDSSNGFTAMVNKTDVLGFDYVLVSYGVNNFSWPEALATVKQNAINGFQALKRKNPNLKILLELPTEDFRQGSKTLYDVNNAFWNQNQLDDMLIDVAKQEGLEYYDWRPDPLITYENANQTLGDGNTGVHPTKATMRAIAQRLAEKFKQMAGGTVQPSPPPHIDPPHDNPPKTDKPENKPQPPVVKTVDELRLDRLADLFGIGTNVSNGINRTLNKINELYSQMHNLMGTDSKQVQATLSAPDNSLTRPLRNYVLMSFFNLERAINELVSLCNDSWLCDPKTGAKTELVRLLRVDSLATDAHYKDTVNYNWYLIENKLNTLIGYVNKILKGE